MSRKWGPLGLLVVGLFVALAHLIAFLGRPEGGMYEYWVEGTVGSPVFGLLGALIVWQRPKNRVGLLFLLVGIGSAVQLLSGQYVASSAMAWPANPGVEFAALSATVMQLSVVTGFLILILIFPTGHLASRGWRWVAGAALLGLGLGALGNVFRPGPLEGFSGIRNPIGIEGGSRVLDVVEALGGVLSFVGVFGAIAGLVVRYRRSRGVERAQLKWFAYGVILAILLILLGDTFVPIEMEPRFGTFIWTAGPLAIPVSAGVAILRYRLYDIDLVVNRTLVYATLTAVLAGLYVGIVFTLQTFLAPVASGSDLAVAGSTLVVAGLFRPLRSRIQTFIDHRFYRTKYDATRTVEEFSSRLRNEIDLASLGNELTSVVSETMKPAHVSLWLRSESGA